jgi:hypothetical protein
MGSFCSKEEPETVTVSKTEQSVGRVVKKARGRKTVISCTLMTEKVVHIATRLGIEDF